MSAARRLLERLLRDTELESRLAGMVLRELLGAYGEETSAADLRAVAAILDKESAILGDILVVSRYTWGKGTTEKEALRRASQTSRGHLQEYSVYRVHPATTVDELGDIVHPPSHWPQLLREVRRSAPGKEEE